MQSFLEDTLDTILAEQEELASLRVILPSKRAGAHLKNLLRKKIDKTSFAPEILDIESFVELIADLKIVDNTQLLFTSYKAYRQTKSIVEHESFELFSTWITALLNDFNEVDRYMVPTKAFFDYMGSIKSLEKWNVKAGTSELIENYLKFWESLPAVYSNLKNLLVEDGLGFQGMVYRKAAEDIEHYMSSDEGKPHIFIGFNALNTAEQQIISAILEAGNSHIYWDADRYFVEDQQHSASVFMRKYFSEWPYYQKYPVPEFPSNFEAQKNLSFVGAPKQITQAKYVGDLLSNLSSDELDQTGIVLSDERLLIPLLHSLPDNVKDVNITMGLTLGHFPLAVWFQSVMALHNGNPSSFYHKDITAVLSHPTAAVILDNPSALVNNIVSNNRAYITFKQLYEMAVESDKDAVQLIFSTWKDDPSKGLECCLELIDNMRTAHSPDSISTTLLYNIHDIVQELVTLHHVYPYINSVKALTNLFHTLLSQTTIDIQGDALRGLQIMGVLETRLLDFKRVIMTSVNEGIIPAGKSHASFITNDLKAQFNLPHYFEKDAIYTYHFYRLLHRAKDVSLIYNSHSEGLDAGEKSRFIYQLEVDKCPEHTITTSNVVPNNYLQDERLRSIEKNNAIMEQILDMANEGFSPSALGLYIKNPVDFYFEKILGIKEREAVEETVDYNTLGTIVHNTLQKLYEPYTGQELKPAILEEMIGGIETEVVNQFKFAFKDGDFSTGKNLIIFEVAKQYVKNMIQLDLKELKSNNTIQLIAVEKEYRAEIKSNSAYPVRLKGIIDRIDRYNGSIRIIDYKTGAVKQTELTLTDWDELIIEPKYSKALQVFAYAHLLQEDYELNGAHTGIISFKNFKSGYLPASIKDNKSRLLDKESLDASASQLVKIVEEICDTDMPFVEKQL